MLLVDLQATQRRP